MFTEIIIYGTLAAIFNFFKEVHYYSSYGCISFYLTRSGHLNDNHLCWHQVQDEIAATFGSYCSMSVDLEGYLYIELLQFIKAMIGLFSSYYN